MNDNSRRVRCALWSKPFKGWGFVHLGDGNLNGSLHPAPAAFGQQEARVWSFSDQGRSTSSRPASVLLCRYLLWSLRIFPVMQRSPQVVQELDEQVPQGRLCAMDDVSNGILQRGMQWIRVRWAHCLSLLTQGTLSMAPCTFVLLWDLQETLGSQNLRLYIPVGWFDLH